jgi:3-dehydrosphinganine reductase
MAKIEGAFNGKIALVTGGSSGIGLATAKLLASNGAQVWLMARNAGKLQSALADVNKARLSTGQRCSVLTADVTDIAQVKKAIKEIKNSSGPIDLLILSAGDVHPCLFKDMDIGILRSTMEVNYFGAAQVIHVCLPDMIARRTGHIVNISSVYGFLSGYGYSSYCASKYALRGFSDSLRLELKPYGINVSIVFPQNTRTPQFEHEGKLKSPVMKELDTTKVMSAGEVAESIVRGNIRRQYIIIPGAEGKWLYRLKLLPDSLTYGIMDNMVSKALKKYKTAGAE